MGTTKCHYKIVVRKDQRTGTNEPCYSSFVPELGISADGDTLEEVRARTDELIKFHIQCLSDEGEEIPVGDPSNVFVFDVSIDVPPKSSTL
jgi:predicted RNase H-like HicB family nuclease